MSLIDQLPSILGGAGSGIATYGALWAQGRHSRQKMAQDLFDRIMDGVRKENQGLHEIVAVLTREVEDCARRDRRNMIVEQAAVIVITELHSQTPKNAGLALAVRMIRTLPPPPTEDPWNDLLARIDAADEASRANR